jgi:hypothetical protein
VKSKDLPGLSDPFRASAWLVAAYLVHLAEEWFFDFPAWSRVIRGAGVSGQEFIIINAVFLALLLLMTATVRRRPAMTWFPVTLALIFMVNGFLHTLASWRYGVFSPGTATGIVVYFPLGVLVLRGLWHRLSAGAQVGCIVASILIHAFVTFVAFR